MAVMGDALPERWTNELRQDGRVVFPIRPRAVWRELGLIWLVVLVTQSISLAEGWGQGARPLFALLIVLIAVVTTFWHTSRLWTHYPALTVDEFGLHIGLRKSIRWPEIGAIGLLRSGLGSRTLPIIPKNTWAKELIIPQTAAKDMKALQQWLEQLLKDHRAADHLTPDPPA